VITEGVIKVRQGSAVSTAEAKPNGASSRSQKRQAAS